VLENGLKHFFNIVNPPPFMNCPYQRRNIKAEYSRCHRDPVSAKKEPLNSEVEKFDLVLIFIAERVPAASKTTGPENWLVFEASWICIDQ
jgi:hypothetical protein